MTIKRTFMLYKRCPYCPNKKICYSLKDETIRKTLCPIGMEFDADEQKCVEKKKQKYKK
jgi:hypothetical protein